MLFLNNQYNYYILTKFLRLSYIYNQKIILIFYIILFILFKINYFSFLDKSKKKIFFLLLSMNIYTICYYISFSGNLYSSILIYNLFYYIKKKTLYLTQINKKKSIFCNLSIFKERYFITIKKSFKIKQKRIENLYSFLFYENSFLNKYRFLNLKFYFNFFNNLKFNFFILFKRYLKDIYFYKI